MLDFLHRLFVPHHSNNHRAKLLHHSSILSFIVLLLSIQVLLVSVKNNFSNVLGLTTDISAQELLLLTNQDRKIAGTGQLTINDQLSQAAYLKAQDMYAKNYWAHNSPDGITPWVFIRKAGYQYVYAGENLARGFTTSHDVVDAWMASPSHKENMLSGNYQDVGFAVMDGKLLGEDTTLVVEEFGGKIAAVAKTPTNENLLPNPNVRSAEAQTVPSKVLHIPLIDSASLGWTISFIVISLFIVVLLVDMIVVDRRRVARFVGHNIDHILYLGSLLVFIIIFTRGVI